MKKEILEWIFCVIVALILALLFKHFIGVPTIVKQRSMYPTLKENQRLVLNRTFKITKSEPQIGDIITFEAPSKKFSKWEADQNNPVAVYNNEPKGLIKNFFYYGIEITKESYIKRVVAIGGNHVKIENGQLSVDGIIQEEKFLQPNVITESDVFYDFIVPEGYVFAMGDNRSNSTDCREFGCIPLEKIEGIAVFRFWPFNEITTF